MALDLEKMKRDTDKALAEMTPEKWNAFLKEHKEPFSIRTFIKRLFCKHEWFYIFTPTEWHCNKCGKIKFDKKSK
jgi:predicted N-acyltransferase